MQHVIAKDEGTVIWQPQPSNSTINNKISAWNVDENQHTVFCEEIPPGGVVGEHSHEAQAEVFIGISGSGVMASEKK